MKYSKSKKWGYVFFQIGIICSYVLFIGCGISEKETVVVHEDVLPEEEYGVFVFLFRNDFGHLNANWNDLVKKTSITITPLQNSGTEYKYRMQEGDFVIEIIDYAWAKDRVDAREVAEQLLEKHSN